MMRWPITTVALGACDAENTDTDACLGLFSPLLLEASEHRGCCAWKILDFDLFIQEVRSLAKSVEELSPTLLWR